MTEENPIFLPSIVVNTKTGEINYDETMKNEMKRHKELLDLHTRKIIQELVSALKVCVVGNNVYQTMSQADKDMYDQAIKSAREYFEGTDKND